MAVGSRGDFSKGVAAGRHAGSRTRDPQERRKELFEGWRLKVEIWTRNGSYIQCWIETRIRGVETGRWGQRIPAGFVRVKAGLQVLLLISHIQQESSRNFGQTSCLLLRLDGYKLDAGWHNPGLHCVRFSLYIRTYECVRLCERVWPNKPKTCPRNFSIHSHKICGHK